MIFEIIFRIPQSPANSDFSLSFLALQHTAPLRSDASCSVVSKKREKEKKREAAAERGGQQRHYVTRENLISISWIQFSILGRSSMRRKR